MGELLGAFRDEHQYRDGYLDRRQIDEELSFAIATRNGRNGSRRVYQFVTMLDGTRYELLSQSGSTRGILVRVLTSSALRQDIEALVSEVTIGY